MKKILILLLIAALAAVLAACNPTPADTTADPSATTSATTADPTINQPAEEGTPLTVLSCQQISFVNGERTYRLTFSNGSTADFSVKDGKNGVDGTPAPALTVLSCTAVSTDAEGVTTWRITFSDGSNADFTVSNATPMDGNVDWEELLAKIEEMTDLLTVKAPDMSVGNSTVTDHSKTTAGAYNKPNTAGTYVTGQGFPLTKRVMFGSANEVLAMRLNRYRIFDRDGAQMTSGEFTIEIQIREYDTTYRADKTGYVTSYTTKVTLVPGQDYIDLTLTIPRSDFAKFEEDTLFMMIINVLSDDAGYALRCSSNATFFLPYTDRVINPNGSQGGFLYAGYVADGIAKRGASNSYSATYPDIFFSTAMKSTPIDLSGLVGAGGGSGNAGGSGTGSAGGNAPELSTDHLLQLPAQYDLVVGDTFELFYKGITLCLDSDVFDYELRYADGKSRGNNYSKKYVWTPTEADIGVHTLTVDIRDNYGRIVDTGTVKMNVVNKPKSPSSERTYLFIGASTLNGGVIPKEVIRRLTGTTNVISSGVTGPMGDGLTNIKTIGTITSGTAADDVRYEGYGGWSAESYTTANASRPYFVYIHGSFDPEALTQHAYYSSGKDTKGNDILWKLELIEEDRIKLIAVSANGNVDTARKDIATSGTLTLAGGGTDTDAKTITYTSTSKAEGNPFWSVEKQDNDFLAYAERMGVEKIDEVIIILGWNSTTTSPIIREAAMRKLVDGILRDFPECHVTLCGLQVPSRDGFGTNYGISWNYYEKLSAMYDMQAEYMAIAADPKYNGQVSFAHVTGQFDAETTYPTTSTPINNRNPNKTDVQNNGLHPNKIGSYMIADAMYRHLVTRLQ